VSDARFHLRVQRYGWDLAATTYDDGWVPILTPHAAACVDALALAPGERVLDVATGPGTAAFLAARKVGPRGAVVGSDIAQRMVELAAARAAERGLPQLEFRRGDMETPLFDAGSFDALTCVFGLMFAADARAAMREMARVLRPGGRAAVAVWGRRARCGWAEVFPIIERRVTSDVCPLFFGLGGEGALRAGLMAAGFEDVRELRVETALRWPDAERALDAMLAGGAVALAYSRFAPEVRAAVRREYAAAIAAYRDGDGYTVPAEMVFATARRPASC
jgi:ubiquinone/menaquinone biosynthesis C-methylase UbiE